jgi:hypothetical protein
LRKRIANALSKATALCNAPGRVNRAPGFSLHKRPFVQASDLSDDETFTRRFHHRFGYFFESVDFENPLDLRQQTKIATGGAVNDRDCFRF